MTKLFQFLIGRLATDIEIAVSESGIFLFQFLIGRLATEKLIKLSPVFIRFQFLIGRLATSHK